MVHYGACNYVMYIYYVYLCVCFFNAAGCQAVCTFVEPVFWDVQKDPLLFKGFNDTLSPSGPSITLTPCLAGAFLQPSLR